MLRPRLSCVSASSASHLALHLAHGALEHGGVQLEADGFDVAALLAAEHVAGAAQFEIERGDLEACAEVARIPSARPGGGARVGVSSRSGGISRYA